MAAAVPAMGACLPPPRPPASPDVARYRDPEAWLCLPGRDDPCSRALTATAIEPDGAHVLEASSPPPEPAADCFYVYPTVDLSVVPGNHDDFADLAPMVGATDAQAHRFRDVCALYVPLYRQVTIGAYVFGGDQLEARLELAYSDIEAAFRQYLATYNRGRPIVLVGHSQGAHLLTRLVQRLFDRDPAMRARLAVALLVGGDVQVPRGRTVGATFAHVPLCTRAGETGCVVAFRSHQDGLAVDPGRNAPREGDETACVNPASLGSTAPHVFAGSYFPLNDSLRKQLRGVADIGTPFVAFHEFYAGRCADAASGYRYLAVSVAGAPGDLRANPVDFGAAAMRSPLGLHVLDFQIPQDDLIEVVRRAAQAAARQPVGRP